MKDFRSLDVWDRAHKLTLRVYEITETFPKKEIYGLTSQIRRACASIPTNISEGCGRKTDADFARFVQIAFGSASELEYLFLLTRDLKMIEDALYQELNKEINEIKKMLNSLMKKLRAKR